MAITFTEEDLLVDISQEELDGIAKDLVSESNPQPIASTIEEQVQKVEDYTLRFAVPDLRFKRLLRALVLYELYSRLAEIPEKRKLKHEEAMKELRDIRDGKFPDLMLEEPPPAGTPTAQGNWGSKEKLT
jgi:hypothetical protein